MMCANLFFDAIQTTVRRTASSMCAYDYLLCRSRCKYVFNGSNASNSFQSCSDASKSTRYDMPCLQSVPFPCLVLARASKIRHHLFVGVPSCTFSGMAKIDVVAAFRRWGGNGNGGKPASNPRGGTSKFLRVRASCSRREEGIQPLPSPYNYQPWS